LNTTSRSGLWALAAISFFWGTTWFTSKIAITYLPPLQMTGIRQLLAGSLLIAFYTMKVRKIPPIKDLIFHALVGFLLFTCSNGMTTWAIQYIPSFLGALLGCLMPFVLVLANYLLFKEKVKPLAFLGLAIGFVGVAILLSSFATEIKETHFVWGVLITMVGVLTWTSGTLITTRNKRNIDPFEGLGWQMLFGGAMMLLISGVMDEQVNLLTLPIKAWLLIGYLIAVGSIFCFVCYLHALKTLPLSLVSVYVYINPIVALLMGVLFLHEVITWQIVVGVLVVFSGIYLVKRYR